MVNEIKRKGSLPGWWSRNGDLIIFLCVLSAFIYSLVRWGLDAFMFYFVAIVIIALLVGMLNMISGQ